MVSMPAGQNGGFLVSGHYRQPIAWEPLGKFGGLVPRLGVGQAVHQQDVDDVAVVVIDRFGSQLCSSDIMRTVDRSGGFITGPLFWIYNIYDAYTDAERINRSTATPRQVS